MLPDSFDHFASNAHAKIKHNFSTTSFCKRQVSSYASLFSQWAFTWSKLTIETLEQGVKYVQS